MRWLIYTMGVALGGLVVLVLASAMRADMSLAQAARSIGWVAIGGLYAPTSEVHTSPVVTILAALLSLVFQFSFLVAAVGFTIGLVIRIAKQTIQR